MLTPHRLSETTWGRVLSLTDGKLIGIRPDGSKKRITHTERVGKVVLSTGTEVTLTPKDAAAAAIFGPTTITLPGIGTYDLGQRTWDKEVEDIDPQWQAWIDAGLITPELLADVPRPQAEIDAIAKEGRRDATEAAERSQLEQMAAQSLARLDQIIAAEATATPAQVRTAVVDLAKMVKRLVKIIARTET